MTDSEGAPRDRAWIGRFGESVTVAWLRANGIKVLARNFRARGGGEVDIVAREGNVLIFLEVKTRREGTHIRPYDAVDAAKKKLIEKGANAWLKRLGRRDMPWRFDVAEVYLQDGSRPRVNLIRNAF